MFYSRENHSDFTTTVCIIIFSRKYNIRQQGVTATMDRVDDDIRETMHIYSTHTQKNTTLLKLYITTPFFR